MNLVLTLMEMIRLAPKGSGKVRERPRAAHPMHGTSGSAHTRPSTAGTQAIPSRRMPSTYLRAASLPPGARDAPPRPGWSDDRRPARHLHAHVLRPREQARAGVKQREGLRGAGATLAGGLSLRLELWDEAAASAYMTGAEESWAARVYTALDLEMASVYVTPTCVRP